MDYIKWQPAFICTWYGVKTWNKIIFVGLFKFNIRAFSVWSMKPEEFITELASFIYLFLWSIWRSLSLSRNLGGTPYNGLYGEAPPKRGTFLRLQVYKRVVISQVEYIKGLGNRSLRYLKGPLIVKFRVDAPYGY